MSILRGAPSGGTKSDGGSKPSGYFQIAKQIFTRPEQKPSAPKVAPKDTSILGGEDHISTKKAIWEITKHGPRNIPGSDRKYTEEQRKKLAESSFKRFGPFLDAPELRKVIEDKEKIVKDPFTSLEKRKEAGREIKYLKKTLFGK